MSPDARLVAFKNAIAGRYLIDAEAGRGGMAIVYLARDVRLNRPVALKVLAPEQATPDAVTAFRREIDHTLRLEHPNILPILDAGVEQGLPFYVMRFLKGGSLRRRLEHRGRLSVRETAGIVRQAAAALEYAHGRRILHCDVKPENILLDGDHVYLADFGIARAVRADGGEWLSPVGISGGTPSYVSPEQALGDTIDQRTDLYSLACVAYEMLAGKAPFTGGGRDTMARRFTTPPDITGALPAGVPLSLRAAIAKALSPAPDDRQPTVGTFAAAFDDQIGQVATASPSGGVMTQVRAAFAGLAADIRYAIRSLRRNAGYTAVVALTLALGIGANTAIFSVVRGVLLKPLPHRDGDRLLYLRHSADGPGLANLNFSVPEVRDLRTGVPALASIAEHSSWGTILQTADGTERISVGLVTGNFFEVMGLSPVLGRVTGPGDDGPSAAPVVILSHAWWRSRFGGDSGIVGQQVRFDGAPVTVIGVLEPAPFFPVQVHALANMVNSEHHMSASMVQGRSHRMTEVVARLAPGATLDQARAQVAQAYGRMQRDNAEAYDAGSNFRVATIPFKEVMGERARLTLTLLMGAAAFVLLIAAANVANLTLMRGVRREPELVARAALGAGVARLRRLLLAENLVLTLLGAGLGVYLAIGGVKLLVSLAERYSPRASEIRLDAVVLGFTLAVSVVLALLMSVLVSLPGEGSLAARIAAAAARMRGSLKKQRLQRGLVVAQVAASVVLLAGAGLLTRTLIRLSQVDTGLATEDVLTMQVTLLNRVEARDTSALALARQRFDQIKEEVRALPGVNDVGIGGTLPLRAEDFFNLVEAEGRPPAPGEAVIRGEFRTADPDYFRAAGIPMVAGRAFERTDQLAGVAVIINQTLAERLFPNEDPIGRRLGWKAEWFRDSLHWRTVVGVVGNTRDGGMDAAPRSVLYTTRALAPVLAGSSGLVIRAEGDMANLAATVQRIARRIAPAALIENVMTVAQYKQRSLASRRLNAVLVSSFGILAVIIAAVGIAGVLAFSVSVRTNEIGIRMSLGADGSKVQRMILAEGGVLLGLGLVLGVAGAFFASRAIRGLLFGVEPHDPATFAAVAVAMASIGIAACWIPALRAARIDPVVAMRYE